MSMLSEKQAREILDKVVKLSKADECTASLTGTKDGNIRFALNNVSTSGIVSDIQLAVQVAYGKKVGVATINEFDDAALARVVARAQELAQLAPENDEFMPALGKQQYKSSAPAFVKASSTVKPEYRAQVAVDSIEPCKSDELVAAGFFTDNTSFSAFATSTGNFGYHKSTTVDYTCTVRTDDGTGSGWVNSNVADVNDFSAKSSVSRAIAKAKGSVDAKAIEPGKYTVILEPAAASGLVGFMLLGFDARQADEGRSFLSKKGGGTKMGEQMFDKRINIAADPWDERAPVQPWDSENRPRSKMPIVDDGKIVYMNYSRYWAKKQEVDAGGQPGNILIAGGSKSTDELVASTKRGILVTRTWYIRMVDPQSVLLTGLTRDGTFYIEDGEIKYPIKNMRFNESPVIMLNNVEELGIPERSVMGGGGPNGQPVVMMMPAMKIRDFTFTSLSDAV